MKIINGFITPLTIFAKSFIKNISHALKTPKLYVFLCVKFQRNFEIQRLWSKSFSFIVHCMIYHISRILGVLVLSPEGFKDPFKFFFNAVCSCCFIFIEQKIKKINWLLFYFRLSCFVNCSKFFS